MSTPKRNKSFCKELYRTTHTTMDNKATTCVCNYAFILSQFDDKISYSMRRKLLRKFPCITYESIGDGTWAFCTVVKATAIPRHGDVYDKKEGETIAHSKCQLKAFKRMYKFLLTLTSLIDQQYNEFINFKSIMEYNIGREEEFLKFKSAL